jgi:Zn-dependent protease
MTSDAQRGLVRGSARIARVGAADVVVHWSAALIAGVLAQRLAVARFPNHAPGYSRFEYVIAGVATGLAFLASVVAHEIGHALAARRDGIGVEGITLWLLGGVTEMSTDAATPRSEFAVAAAGPATSLALGVILTGAGIALHAVNGVPLLAEALGWLGAVNLLVAVFNALPGLPLDGGRMLYAVMWKCRHDRLSATRVAGRAGAILGAIVVATGLTELVRGAAVPGALSIVIVGWFLIHGALAEGADAERRSLRPQPGAACACGGASPRAWRGRPRRSARRRWHGSRGNRQYLRWADKTR